MKNLLYSLLFSKKINSQFLCQKKQNYIRFKHQHFLAGHFQTTINSRSKMDVLNLERNCSSDCNGQLEILLSFFLFLLLQLDIIFRAKQDRTG